MQIKSSLSDIHSNLTYKSYISSINRIEIPLTWMFNPLAHYTTKEFFRNNLLYECSKFSSSHFKALRNTIALSSKFCKAKVFCLTKNNFNDNETTDLPRDLRFMEAPICLILDTAGQVLASDRYARLKIAARLTNFTLIPSGFYNHFKSIRTSKCGSIRITPKIDFESNNLFLKEHTVFKNSVFDFS